MIPNRNIVDIVLDIMDEGPRPMKNMKVSEKNRNCVDQFWNTHQAEYEAREKLNKDGVDIVNQHNLAHPRLGDELDKRKSLSKVMANLQNDSSKRSYSSSCAACNKLRRLSQLQKMNVKEKCKQRKIKSKTPSRDIKSRVRKNRYETRKRIKSRLPKTTSINKMAECRVYYIPVKHKRVGNDTSTILNSEPKNSTTSDNMVNERMTTSSEKENVRDNEGMNSSERTDDILPDEQMNDLINKEEMSGQNSVNNFKNPDTSVASLSSYNSYASLDHEPMVDMDL